MKAISEEISLNVDAMYAHPNSPEAIIFKDANFTFDKDTFDPYHLLLIGFLYCAYGDIPSHSADLWLLINPQLEFKVPKGKIAELLQDLFYISIDQRLSKIIVYLVY